MIKKLVYFLVLSLVFCSSCKSKNPNRRIWFRSHAKQAAEMEAGQASVRDRSVTKENAYNDLFLDSLAFEKYVVANNVSDSVAENMRDFYNVRNYEYAWFDSKGLTEQALGFRSLYKYATDSVNKQLDARLDELLLHESSVSANDASIQKIEFQLTRRFVQFVLDAYKDQTMHAHDLETFVPIKKQPVLQMADDVLASHSRDNDKVASLNPLYSGLRDQLQKYVTIAKNGGWDTLTVSKTKFVLGKNFPELLKIKRRLAATGEFTANGDTTATFTPELEAAVKDYQESHGMTPDGKITPLLVKNMNIPVNRRIEQLLVNMQRMHWLPVKREGKLIMVNIPEFMLHVTDGNSHIKHMPVVVGKEGHTTVMFSDDLDQIVFSPYWNIPPSIVKAEILPSMNKNSNYLEQKNMEIVSGGGSLPTIRQKPGPGNSLGRVKFLFPNSFNIYFHDTPSKNLFEKDVRAYSHGCIRISDPVWMANYLLENSPEWTPERIEDAMNAGVEKTVRLKHSVPVIITYYTAWIDENNKMNFRDDVYGNDHDVAVKLFTDNASPAVQIAKK